MTFGLSADGALFLCVSGQENGALRIFFRSRGAGYGWAIFWVHDVNLKLLLNGQLFAVRGESDTKRQQCTLEGWVRMSTTFDLLNPSPCSRVSGRWSRKRHSGWHSERNTRGSHAGGWLEIIGCGR